jgi:tetratricopeptide (TPR) repeat protein
VFVCYAHRDSEDVYADLTELTASGINVWYDEGIPAGTSWRAEIAAAIEGASKLLFYISGASLDSAHCLREVDYALNHDIEIVPVYLEDCSLPGELELVLNRVHALFRKTDTMYMDHLLGAMQGRQSIASLGARAQKREARAWLPYLAIGLGLLAVLAWTQRDVILGRDVSPAATVASDSAFDKYLEGLELLERWDKGDNVEVAIGLFREAVSLDPTFALAYARLADGLRIHYALTGEDAWLDEATENVETAVGLNAELGPVQVALGRIHAMRGNMDLALAAMERAVAIDPNDAVANQAIAGVYARLGRLEDAESSYRKALALDPENQSIHDSYAYFLSDQSRFDDAIHHWRAVIRIAPDHYAALVNLGSVLAETGKLSEAITMYQRAIEIRPTYMAYSNLGTAYSRAERYPEAVDAYRQAIEVDETDWLAWGNLAYIYSWTNEDDALVAETFDRAIKLAEAERERNPREPFVHSDLALYYAKTGQADLAVQRLETAVTLAPDTGEILAAAAEAYEVMGQRDQAIELALRSLEFGFTRQLLGRNPELAELLSDPRLQPAP